MTIVLQMLETGKAKSPIHACDPRMKLLWWICLIIVPILVTNPVLLLIYTVLIWVLAGIAGIVKKMYQFLIVTYPIMVGFIILTWPFFYPATPEQTFLFNWSIFHVSVEGMVYAGAMGLRIVLALTACTFFVMTTDLMDLASGLGEFMQNKLKISYMYPLMVISSFKFIPELSGDYVTITDAFRSRALDIDSGSFFQRLKKLAPVSVPLIDTMLRRAQRISIALEVKAFSVNNLNRTFYKEHHVKFKDLLFLSTGLLALLTSILAVVFKVAKVEMFF
jgi:energy-coupling factor transport system permease protein